MLGWKQLPLTLYGCFLEKGAWRGHCLFFLCVGKSGGVDLLVYFFWGS